MFTINSIPFEVQVEIAAEVPVAYRMNFATKRVGNLTNVACEVIPADVPEPMSSL